jgi:hypothetical protein
MMPIWQEVVLGVWWPLLMITNNTGMARNSIWHVMFSDVNLTDKSASLMVITRWIHFVDKSASLSVTKYSDIFANKLTFYLYAGIQKSIILHTLSLQNASHRHRMSICLCQKMPICYSYSRVNYSTSNCTWG